MRKEEMETIVRFDAVANCWVAWSCIPKHVNAMKKKGWTLTSEDNEGFASFTAPPHSIKISSVKKPQKRSLSDEEKLALRKRLTGTADSENLPEN